ncbi:hypothetical protein ACQPZP_32820 [Spirillospora sp. CA-142024]|uniref:hypothetical protein n=1 Tax=Spirillospora sp. CA-142024 TaxID=3240036 RepID=UPI003D943D9D
MTMRRMLAMTGGALAPLALLSLVFGNQWVVDAIIKSDFEFDEGIGPLVSWMLMLGWRFTPRDGLDWRQVVTADLSLLIFFGVLVLLVVAGARLADPGRSPFGAVIIGWWATVVAGGASGLVAGPLANWAYDLHGHLSRMTFSTIGQGASFGLAFGWLAGLGALAGFFLTRPREGGPPPPQPYGPPQPYAPQPGMPMQQQPYPQPMQPPHPSAVPYVPPQGQPPQHGWGAAPVPQQPGQPGQFGAPPVPQQPSAPPLEQPAPAPREDEPPQDEPPQDAPDDASGEAPENPPENRPGSGPESPPESPPDDDDLDLADRTIIDRKRDDDDG